MTEVRKGAWIRNWEATRNGLYKAFFKLIFSLTTYVMVFTAIVTIQSALKTPELYRDVLAKSNVSVPASLTKIAFRSQHPVWFKMDSCSISTNRALEYEDVIELQSLVSDTCTNHPVYVKAIGDLAYESNNNTDNIESLIRLTLCFVILGCSARTLYDFVGRKCYKHQIMWKWWPWYLIRPIICAPIAALLIVSVRTSFFSNLFVSKDLNSYLVVSFVAGFAIMEFLTMLRRVSKSLFDASESYPRKEGKDKNGHSNPSESDANSGNSIVSTPQANAPISTPTP